MSAKFTLPMLVAIACSTSSQAREALLLRFDIDRTNPDSSVRKYSDVEDVMRLHLKIISQESFLLSGSNHNQHLALHRRRNFRIVETAAFLKMPATALTAACRSVRYRSTWWLPKSVEARRAANLALVAAISCEYGIPAPLLDAVVAQESGYKSWAVSSAGAIGMMQIMPGTAKELGLANPWDPVANLRAGANYLGNYILCVTSAKYDSKIGTTVQKSRLRPR